MKNKMCFSQASHFEPEKQTVCVCSGTQRACQRTILDQIKQKALSQRRARPFVTHVADNPKNTTTKNSMSLHSPLFTVGNHFRGRDSWITRANLREIISKERQHRRTRGDLRPEDLSGRGSAHFMPLSPSVQWEIRQQVSVEEASLLLRAGGRKSDWFL